MTPVKKPSWQTWANFAYDARERAEKADAKVQTLEADANEAWERVELLEEVIRSNLPYHYDQGESDEDPATPEECVEYASKELVQLRKEVERLKAERDAARDAAAGLQETLQNREALLDERGRKLEAAWKETETLLGALLEIRVMTFSALRDWNSPHDLMRTLRQIDDRLKEMEPKP